MVQPLEAAVNKVVDIKAPSCLVKKSPDADKFFISWFERVPRLKRQDDIEDVGWFGSYGGGS